MPIANPETLASFVNELAGHPSQDAIARTLEVWVAAVREVDVKTWASLVYGFDAAMIVLKRWGAIR